MLFRLLPIFAMSVASAGCIKGAFTLHHGACEDGKARSKSGVCATAERSELSAHAVATPVASPSAGTYSAAQTVTLSTTTAGASIYYTVDGSTPTSESMLYAAPIQVAASQTIKAIGVMAGHSNSEVATFSYKIDAKAALCQDVYEDGKTSTECPAQVSCKAIYDAGYSYGDGLYPIDPDGAAGPLAATSQYCAMNNGGWTLVARVIGDNANIANSILSPTDWYSATTVGSATGSLKYMLGGDYQVNFNEFNARVNGTWLTSVVYGGAQSFESYTGMTDSCANINTLVLGRTPSGGCLQYFSEPNHAWLAGTVETYYAMLRSSGPTYNLPDLTPNPPFLQSIPDGADVDHCSFAYQMTGFDAQDGYYCRTAHIGMTLATNVDTVEIFARPTLNSCKAIYDAGLSTGDGTYMIDPDGAGPVAATSQYCSMSNGGWTLVARVIGDNSDIPNSILSPTDWASTTTVGSATGSGKYMVGGQYMIGFSNFNSRVNGTWLTAENHGSPQTFAADVSLVVGTTSSGGRVRYDKGPNNGWWDGSVETFHAALSSYAAVDDLTALTPNPPFLTSIPDGADVDHCSFAYQMTGWSARDGYFCRTGFMNDMTLSTDIDTVEIYAQP